MLQAQRLCAGSFERKFSNFQPQFEEIVNALKTAVAACGIGVICCHWRNERLPLVRDLQSVYRCTAPEEKSQTRAWANVYSRHKGAITGVWIRPITNNLWGGEGRGANIPAGEPCWANQMKSCTIFLRSRAVSACLASARMCATLMIGPRSAPVWLRHLRMDHATSTSASLSPTSISL